MLRAVLLRLLATRPRRDRRRGETIVVPPVDFVETGCNRHQRLPRSGLTVAGHEGDVGIEKGIDKALLSKVERLEAIALRDTKSFRDGEAGKDAIALESCSRTLVSRPKFLPRAAGAMRPKSFACPCVNARSAVLRSVSSSGTISACASSFW